MVDAAIIAKSGELFRGSLVGGISALAQKKALRTFLDSSAEQLPSLYISAGRRGLEVELAAADVLQLTRGQYADIATLHN